MYYYIICIILNRGRDGATNTRNADVVSCSDAPPTRVWVERLTSKAYNYGAAPGPGASSELGYCHLTVSRGASDDRGLVFAAVCSVQVPN